MARLPSSVSAATQEISITSVCTGAAAGLHPRPLPGGHRGVGHHHRPRPQDSVLPGPRLLVRRPRLQALLQTLLQRAHPDRADGGWQIGFSGTPSRASTNTDHRLVNILA